ncbi:MAG: ABC transporter ATP-binding protein [Candidatus Bathyarchaeia archaeon]
MKLLEGKKISKRFGGLLALNDVDFYVDAGEIVGLIGPNGAGKTTLFNVIAGTFPPTSGELTFEGIRINGLKPHQICKLGIARTFQTPKPFPNMTVYENVLVPFTFGRRAGKSPSIRQEIEKLLGDFGLAEKSMTTASKLPLFEQRLLELVKAVSLNPKLLLLDEVMAGLNPAETEKMLKTIQGLRDSGVTVFMIEHNMRALMKIAERIMVLHHGSKICEGPPEEIVKNRKVIEAYLGEAYVSR